MDFYDEYGCEEWVAAFADAALRRAGIKATEIYVEDMDEYDISLRVRELDTASGRTIENSYTIRYFDDDMAVGYLFLLYVLYRDGDHYSERLGIGACKITSGNTSECVPMEN